MKNLVYVFILLLFLSCENSEYRRILRVISYWKNREIIFPKDTSFISYSRKRKEQKVHLQKGNYTVFCYVDSMGCMSCKLQLSEWGKFIHLVDSISQGTVPFIFVFQSKAENDLVHFLKKAGFNYPLFIDVNNSFGQLNKFPSDIQLQTFLLNADNRVVAIGNPIYNPKIKEFYMNIIQGKTPTKENELTQTEIQVKESTISLGHFNWQEEQRRNFILYNVGKRPLVINDVSTSCGCTSVDYSKQPVRPGDSISLQVTYKADKPEHFNKTITVYCNTNPSLVHLRIVGDAE